MTEGPTGAAGAGPVVGGRYRLGEVIGYGGMAEVHRGVDTRLGRTVAVKLLRASLASDATFQARFRQEAQSAASLNHPNVISVYDFGDGATSVGAVARLPYIVMEFVEGRTLRDIIRQERRLLPERALEIVAEILSALDYSHRMGIIHRDIKPANVMLTPRGDVKVMDFGIARAVAETGSSMTQTSAVIGTAQYLSPEQARGQTVDARSDLYSTGCLLYELLTGRPPFTADSPVALALAHVREAAVPPDAVDPSVPAAASAITMMALAKNLDDRYASAWEMREDIERALAGQPVHARAVSAIPPAATDDARTELMRPGVVGGVAAVRPPAAAAESPGEQTGWSVPTAAALPPVLAVPPAGATATAGPRGEGAPGGPPAGGRSRRAGLTAGLIVLVIVVLAGLAYGFYAVSRGGTPSPVASGSPTVSVSVSSAAPSPSAVASSRAPSSTASSPSASVSTAAAVTIPGDLVGSQLADVEARLTSLDLTYSTSQMNSIEPANTVLSVDPGPGSTATPGQSVAIVYASGNTQVPDVRGLSVERASELLTQDNFVPAPVLASGVGDGTVTRQTPRDNAVAPQGSTVTIFYKAPASASPSAPASSAPPASSPATSKSAEPSDGASSSAAAGSSKSKSKAKASARAGRD